MKHTYKVDNDKITVELDNKEQFKCYNNEILSQRFGDLIENKNWFNKGFIVEKSLRFFNIEKLFFTTEKLLKKIIINLNSKINLDGFSLERYHHYVDDELHSEVIKKTRRLFPSDLEIDITQILKEFSKYFGTKLTFTNPITGEKHWMIARINRPLSNNYNTVHKDIYEIFDKYGYLPKMVNIWIPLCGVTKTNSLPIVPESHLLSEHLIERTLAGSKLNGNSYSVASIKCWNGKSNLSRVIINKDDVLIFSSHLIHGLAFNNNKNVTRISFEFRLYEDSN